MFRQPGLVYAATADDLRRAYERAISRGVEFAVFTDELFTTGNDGANRSAVKAVKQEDLSLVGIAFRAERNVADKVVKGLKFHP